MQGVKIMPVYEYRCQECGKEFTKTLTLQEYTTTSVKCPQCSSAKVGRRFTSVYVKTDRKS